ncbi:alpha/beta hydrolase [Dissulfurirhabdus thermomarina]|uniref:Alpha/beta hydrolase n=1 Tax=Dissulfurirhabdus thermomarina TaxID=1765737 RepID=A0A6N9TK88_DISTH|nr:alpha/beta hydrolase [Dissulfurirhabdus thermomarina]NDY41665.1 alpha/beta hydrolase [Dissulfurirhabdus thermomarina]NMX24357.1 alpha/beta hydrolase [Dissulfurirhabdus thermomarina]
MNGQDVVQAGLLVLAGAVVAAAAYLLALYLRQARLLYQPTAALAATPADAGLVYEDVRFPAADGTALSGWYLPGPPGGPVLLFCHGNAGNISHRLESLVLFHRMGLGVFIFDYRGYGRSSGTPDEAGTHLDALEAWRWLVERRGIPPGRIVVFGRSLGGAVAARLAAEVRPAALVVESAFTSLPDLAAELFPHVPLVRRLCRFRYNTREHLRRVRCPVLVVHSPEDEIVPFHHGEANFEAATGDKAFLRITGGHNDGFLRSGATYTAGLARFLHRAGAGVREAP